MSFEQPNEHSVPDPPVSPDMTPAPAVSRSADGPGRPPARRDVISAILGVVLTLVSIFAGGVTGTILWVYYAFAVLLAIAIILLLVPRGWRRKVLAGVPVIAVITAGTIVLHPQIREFIDPSCKDPVELTVLLPVDGAFGFNEAIGEFAERYIDESGCKRANVTAYSALWPEVRNALELGWEIGEGLEPDDPLFGFAPQRDVGPRPDLWLTESAAQIALAEELLDGARAEDVLDAEEAEPIGSTPLVVAVPDQFFDVTDRALAEPLPELVQKLGEQHGLSVLRSDPTLSHTALLFLDHLYSEESNAVGVLVEKQLSRSAENIGLGLPGTDTELICELTKLPSPAPGSAVLTTERALAQYNRGDPLGEGCPVSIGSRAGYSPLYLDGLGGLDYQTVRLHWEDPWAERRSEVAEDLTDWLAGENEAWAPEQIGVRSNGYDGAALEGGLQFDLGYRSPGEPLDEDTIGSLLDSYSESRVSTNVLLAIDGSLSMGTQVSGEGRNRFELAAEGVRVALGKLGPRDAAGLWTFPAEGGGAHDVLLEIATERSPQDADLLADQPLTRGVGLHRTLMEGVEALEAAAGADSVEAMVVLTDGADHDGDISVDDVLDHVTASKVSVYIIAVGDASCRAKNFADMTESSRISCIEAEEGQVNATFDSLFGQLWS